MLLEGKIALVTGAGSGFGEGIARRYSAEGARVAVVDLEPDRARRVASEIAGIAVTADVTKDAEVARMVEETVAAFGGLDILVNNAGWSHRNKPVLDVTEDEFDRVFAVNVKAVMLAIRHAVPVMKARRGASILNIASTAAARPRPGLTWYNASKGALVTATKSLALELAPMGIRVNCLNPVLGQTGLTSTFLGHDTPERRAQFLATIPLGRMSTPEDIAAAASFLASEEARFLTGVALEVDGGRSV